MGETPSFPPSVSYRQLATWLRQAPGDPADANAAAGANEEQQAFETLVQRWSESGRELLEALRQGGPAITEGRSPRQLMALGALQAHLAMALQAQAASGRSQEGNG